MIVNDELGSVWAEEIFIFDMCSSVHFCDNNFYNQHMHTIL
jgi:hypothetical protein